MQSKQRQAGLTMIELMIVVAIASILAAVAAPSFSDFMANTRLTSTMTQLTSDLNRARSEAIKQNLWILVCARASDTACGASWANGWLVCQNNTSTSVACDTTPITVHQAINANFTLVGGAAFVRFFPNGTGTASTLTLASGAKSRTANIVATGNISVSNP